MTPTMDVILDLLGSFVCDSQNTYPPHPLFEGAEGTPGSLRAVTTFAHDTMCIDSYLVS